MAFSHAPTPEKPEENATSPTAIGAKNAARTTWTVEVGLVMAAGIHQLQVSDYKS
jgi:hypothetical protein